jgi:hypothetical protein
MCLWREECEENMTQPGQSIPGRLPVPVGGGAYTYPRVSKLCPCPVEGESGQESHVQRHRSKRDPNSFWKPSVAYVIRRRS